MGGIIWLIIVGVILYRTVKKNPEAQRQMQRAREEAMRNMQRATTEQTAKRNTYTVPKAERTKPNDIVSRAKANSARYAGSDETLKELERDHNHSEKSTPAGPKHTNREETKRAHVSAEEFQNPKEEESLLGSVQDLMVKGYDGNLSFERDFLAEAMDMINSYTL